MSARGQRGPKSHDGSRRMRGKGYFTAWHGGCSFHGMTNIVASARWKALLGAPALASLFAFAHTSEAAPVRHCAPPRVVVARPAPRVVIARPMPPPRYYWPAPRMVVFVPPVVSW